VKRSEDENLDYKQAFEEQKERADRLEVEVAILRDQVRNPEAPKNGPVPSAVSINQPTGSYSEIWAYVREQILQDKPLLKLASMQPEIAVSVRRPTITMSDEDANGRIALLLSEGFFDSPQRIANLNEEFRARGWMAATGRPTPLNLPLSKLAEMGFLRIVGQATYQAVPEMKVRIIENGAAA
jgi:hypothetical protein